MSFYYPEYDNSDLTQFSRLGHPGKYTTAYTYTTGQVDFTGSNYGYGSLIIKTVGGATASLSSGGQIPLGDLTAGVVYDFSISQIKGGTNSIVYVLKRQTGF
jgi:hypothetical protein